MGEDLEEFFLNKKPVRIIVSLSHRTTDNYASAVSREVDATYSHTIKVLQKMKDFDLVQFQKKGRKKEIVLTEKGEDIAEAFRGVLIGCSPGASLFLEMF